MSDIVSLARTLTGGTPDTGGEARRLAEHVGATEGVAAMIGAYVAALNLADARESQRSDHWHLPRERTHLFTLDPRTRRGQRFIRLTTEYVGESASRSVHAFVEVATGHVFKAAGWKAPAPDMRYDLLSEVSVASLRRALDTPGYFTGGYLYK